jgi:4-amino-4-deoxy-L-arabinose transferase-like glycosyltransferase
MSDESSRTHDRPRLRAALAIAAIASVIAVLTLHRIGASDVCGGDEAVEGVAVQQMVEHGHLFPTQNGLIPMYKPPLFHWTGVVIDRALGITKVTAANLRYPSALYAIAGAMLAMFFAAGILGADGAIVAGLTLAGSYQYINLGRFGRVDMTLTFYETLALFAFLWWRPRRNPVSGEFSAPRTVMLYLMALALGLGVLAKGPVGALIPGAAIVIFMIVEGRARQILSMLDPGAIIIGAAIASSWYLACYFGGRNAFLSRQLDSENLGRFFGSLGSMAPWYYVKPLLLNSAPLSLLIPLAVALALSKSLNRYFTGEGPEQSEAGEGNGSCANASNARESVRLLAIFWLVTVIFFTLASYKRRNYLLPLWPASAVMLAWLIMTIPPPRLRRITAWGFGGVCAALIVFNFVYIPRREVATCGGDSFRPVAEEISRVVGAGEPIYLYGFRDDLAPLLFYLDRDAPILDGRLGDAPPGYVLVPEKVWKENQAQALDLEPVLTSEHGTRKLILLRHGASYAEAK